MGEKNLQPGEFIYREGDSAPGTDVGNSVHRSTARGKARRFIGHSKKEMSVSGQRCSESDSGGKIRQSNTMRLDCVSGTHERHRRQVIAARLLAGT